MVNHGGIFPVIVYILWLFPGTIMVVFSYGDLYLITFLHDLLCINTIDIAGLHKIIHKQICMQVLVA